jgi:RNA polymerase sigma factor (sigma-70 family)
MKNFDLALLDRWVHHGDAEAFSELVKCHAAMVYGVCRRILRNEADAQDAAQDCFAELLRMSPDASPVKSSLGGWLHSLATHRALDRLRSDARRAGRESGFAKGMASNREEADLDDIQGYVDEAIAGLPPKLREPVVRHFLEGLSHREISETTGIARRTVSSRITKGIDDVRAHLKKRGVTITSSALASLLTVEASQAVPLALTAALGRFALADGVVVTSAKAGGATGTLGYLGAYGGIVMASKKIALVMVLALVIALGLFWRSTRGGETTVSTIDNPISGQVAVEEPVSVLAEIESKPVGNEATPLAVEEEAVEPVVSVNGEEAPTVATSSISGYAVDELGQPVPGATVVATYEIGVNGETGINYLSLSGRPENQYRTTADRNGEFVISGIRHRGQAQLYAEGPGMQGYAHANTRRGDLFEGVEITLKDGLSLFGRVLGPDGKPARGAAVRVVAMTRWGGDLPDPSTICDESGEFQLVFSRSTSAFLLVSSSVGDALFENISVFSDAFIELRLPEHATIEGEVIHASGEPAEGVRIYVDSNNSFTYSGDGITSHGAGIAYESWTDSLGRYEISSVFPDSRYRIVVRSESDTEISPVEALGALEPGQILRRDITLQELVTIDGTVVSNLDGTPISGAMVSVSTGLDPSSEPSSELSTTADEQGRFSLEVALASGDYYIVPYYDDSSWREAAPAFGQRVHLSPSERTELRLEMDPPFSITLRVTDRNGVPIQSAGIGGAWHWDDGMSTVSTGWRTDQEGLFSHAGFAPFGTYSLSVNATGFLRVEDLDYGGRPGEVFPEETVALYESTGAEGIAVDADGVPLPRTILKVRVRTEGESNFEFTVTTNGQGYFLTERKLPAATATLNISTHPGNPGSPLMPAAWRSDLISFEPGLIHDLGTVVLEASDEEE